ncbi:MAG: heavy-metal-associated domain-containing protein [Burkholderiales bacterium]
MTCGGCARSVTRVLVGVAGVSSADVSLEKGRARVTYDPARTDTQALKAAVERAGYKAP